MEDKSGFWLTSHQICPECGRAIIDLLVTATRLGAPGFLGAEPPFISGVFRVFPKGNARPVPPEVTESYADDFREACLVLADSARS